MFCACISYHDHLTLVNEHKRMVAERMKQSEVLRPVFHIDPKPSPELNLRDHIEESAREEGTPYHSDSRPSSRRGPSRLQHLLHCKLHPISIYCNLHCMPGLLL